jgi:hypothetical protein
MELSIELNEIEFETLQQKAEKLGVLPKQLIMAAISDLLNARDEDFFAAADYVLKKNKELYRRLS